MSGFCDCQVTLKTFFEKVGRVCPGIKSAILRFLSGDSPASHDSQEAVIDKRVQEIFFHGARRPYYNN